MAPSGAGKSTLLHIAGLLEHPDHGDVYIDGRATAILPDAERTRIRRNEIGFVYQSHHLLPEFSALENVLLPQMIRGLSRDEAKKRAVELLTIWAWATGSTTGRRNSPAASSSASPLRARSPMRRAFCWPTSRPEISTLHTADHVFRGADAAGARLRARHHHRHPQHGPRRPHGPAGDVAGGQVVEMDDGSWIKRDFLKITVVITESQIIRIRTTFA